MKQNKYITLAHQHEIEYLANRGHLDALIEYGADMYAQGRIDMLKTAGKAILFQAAIGVVLAIVEIKRESKEK